MPKANVINIDMDKKGDALDRWNKGEIKMLVVHPMSASYGINAQYGGYTPKPTYPIR